MRRVLAISAHVLTAALRSRLVVTMLVVLTATVLLLAATVKGDGTLLGQVRVFVVHALGLAAIALAVTSLWIGCGAVSRDVETRRIRLLAVKPLHPAQLWLGRWLGVVVLHALLWAWVVALVYGISLGMARSGPWSGTERRRLRCELLTARLRLRPAPPDIAARAREWFASLEAHGRVPAGLDRDGALARLEQHLRLQAAVVAPGRAVRWSFAVPAAARADGTGVLRVRFSRSARFANAVRGVFRIRAAGGGPALLTVPFRGKAVGTVDLPVSAAGLFRPGRVLELEFENASGAASEPAAFDPRRPVALLLAHSGYAPNIVHAALVLLCVLTALAALGVTCGTLFSFPVSVFAAAALLLILLQTQLLQHEPGASLHSHHQHQHEVQSPGPVERLVTVAARRAGVLARPWFELDPLDRLAHGVRIPGWMVGRACVLGLLATPLLLGAAGTVALRRRELALPAG